MKTTAELIAWCKSKVGCGYVFGANGQVITESFIQAKAALYPKQYTSGYITASRRWIGKEAYDCGGLIDKFLGIDRNADGYYNKATEKGPIRTMPMIPGMLVFMERTDHTMYHIGVYIGGGKVIEAKGVAYGVVETDLSERSWDYWGKCDLIEYTQEDDDMIKLGDKGTGLVRSWQETLLKLGFSVGEDGADDWFGGDTEQGTKDFQARFGLPQTGIVDAATAAKAWDALRLIPNVDVKPYKDQIALLTTERDKLAGTANEAVGDLKTLAGIVNKYR